MENRRAFIGKMIRLVSPAVPESEVQWAKNQLDDPAREWAPSFLIVVGDYVYRLYRANKHDHFEMAAANADAPGWRYRKQSRPQRGE